jgi:subfamily B ATP-binding cassette protein MsbA
MDMRGLMFDKLVALPTRFYDTHAAGNVIATIAYTSHQVTDAGVNVITVLVRDSLTIAGLMAYMLYLNWKLTLIAFVVAPAIVLVVRMASKRLRATSRESQKTLGDLTHVLEESISGHKVVKVFGGQEYEIGRFHDVSNRMRLFSMKQVVASAINVPTVQLIAAIAMASIIAVVTAQVAENKITVGQVMGFVTAMSLLLPPLKRITGLNEALQRGLAAAETVFALIDQTSEDDSGTQRMGRARGEIELSDTTFSYTDANRPALNHVSLHIRPGERVALVGQSGSGKTTLANLIPRFYPLTHGQILLDGQNTDAIRLADLRANIALVSQEVVLFNDTVAANIAYGGRLRASRADIEAAAEAAHAMEFIRDMPQGLDTPIGEKGSRLSGGQRQRIAIARAILKDAPILILDEATSALDTESERHVQAALDTLMRGRTTLIIAHRLSTIENADRIVVMRQGEIVETGTHRELLAQEGVYAHLHRLQFSDTPGGNA